MLRDQLHTATMDVVKKYGKVQYNLGQLNMINATGSPGDVHWEELRREAQEQSDAAVIALDNTLKVLCYGNEELAG